LIPAANAARVRKAILNSSPDLLIPGHEQAAREGELLKSLREKSLARERELLDTIMAFIPYFPYPSI
jgi:hypothetical protein